MAGHLLRVLAESKNSSFGITDAATLEPLFWWRGNDIRLEAALTTNGTFLTASGVGTITAVVKGINDGPDDSPSMLKTIASGDCDAGFDGSTWPDGTGQLFATTWTRAEAALAAGEYVLVISHDDPSGNRNTFLRARVTVREDQHDSVSLTSPPSPPVEYYTRPEADAAFIAASDRRGLLSNTVLLPRALQKLYNLNRITFQGADHNFLTVFNLADSMGLLGFYPHLENILENKLGLAGLGFDRLIYKNTAGTVNFPNEENPVGRRFDLWGFGTCMQIESGGVLEIGEPFAGDQVRAFQCTKATFFLATEPGGGTVDIEYYNDSTPGWESLETGVSTDAATGVLIKTYTFTERSVIFRVTGTSGNTELIGALLRNVAHHGLVSCQSAVGGNPLTTINTGNTAIFNAVMAEVEPDLIISQYDEPAASLESAFGTYADAVQAAAPDADHLYWTEHEIDNSGGKEANHWPVYRTKAATLQNLHLFEAETVLPYSLITAASWDDPDAVHLDANAWYYVASVLAWSFGLDPAYGNHEFVKVAQTGSTKIYRLGGTTKSGTLVYEIPGFHDDSVRLRFKWDDPERGERWWEWERKADDDADNPEGYALAFFTSLGSGEAVNVNNAGRLYFGPSANINFDGRGTFLETWAARGCVVTAHGGGATASLLKGYTDLTLATVAYDVKATGVARFKTLDTQDWETAADDTAAATAGVAIGEAYKTATGELRVRIS